MSVLSSGFEELIRPVLDGGRVDGVDVFADSVDVAPRRLARPVARAGDLCGLRRGVQARRASGARRSRLRRRRHLRSLCRPARGSKSFATRGLPATSTSAACRTSRSTTSTTSSGAQGLGETCTSRPASESDLETLKELWLAFERENPSPEYEDVDEAVELSEVEDYVREHVALVVENGEVAKGFVLARMRGARHGWISDLYVSSGLPARRRRRPARSRRGRGAT